MRICEDRGMEPYGQLRDLTARRAVYEQLGTLFARADDKYNSGLFHFRPDRERAGEPDRLTLRIGVDDSILSPIIQRLYWPAGPYDFHVLPSDILGQVYEQFLGKVITLNSQGRASVDDKPEVRKAGGVFYTPTMVVSIIVAEAVGKGLSALTPLSFEGKQPQCFRICDPACGSGSFLLAAYQFLLDWYLNWYVTHNPPRWARGRQQRIWEASPGHWRLTTSGRKRILLQHVFGVDIDVQAVEITKLSLLLKVLEGEPDDTLAQLKIFQERALPDLDRNIKCGNSLVGGTFHANQGRLLSSDAEEHVNAFEWSDEFPEVMISGGFQVLIGNPPWLMAGYYIPETVPYLQEHFQTASGKFDLYYAFIELALRLVSPAGRVGMIGPNKFSHPGGGGRLRELLTRTTRLYEVIDFGDAKLFHQATNYSCIVFLSGQPSTGITYRTTDRHLTFHDAVEVSWPQLSSSTWTFTSGDAREVLARLEAVGVPLKSIRKRFGTGVQTGADRILTLDADSTQALGLEQGLLRPILRGRDVRRFAVDRMGAKSLIFPYEATHGEFRL